MIFGRLGSANTSNGADTTVVTYEENLKTRSCWMQPDTISWLNVTLPAASALTEKKSWSLLMTSQVHISNSHELECVFKHHGVRCKRERASTR